jgi:hypothetical protein
MPPCAPPRTAYHPRSKLDPVALAHFLVIRSRNFGIVFCSLSGQPTSVVPNTNTRIKTESPS